MKKKVVIANWKMNGSKVFIIDLLKDISARLADSQSNSEVVIMPPSLYLPLVASVLEQTCIKWGAQNVYPADLGPFTGELSAAMLQDFACDYVLVGHSERRTLFKENEKFIADKFHHVKERDMIPVLCVGETLLERESGTTKAVLARQLEAVVALHPDAFCNAVIAYEPVWAIGTGQTAHPELIQEVHSIIRSLVTDLGEENGQNVALLYGGSLNELNARSIFAIPEVDGGLIGGASLNAQKFVEIVTCINS